MKWGVGQNLLNFSIGLDILISQKNPSAMKKLAKKKKVSWLNSTQVELCIPGVKKGRIVPWRACISFPFLLASVPGIEMKLKIHVF